VDRSSAGSILQWYAPSGELLGIRAVPHANAPSTVGLGYTHDGHPHPDTYRVQSG